jgi:hypothetical protein
MRSANVVPATEDLGIHYFTSSKEVKAKFNEYTYEILQECDTHEYTHKYEQYLIWNCRKDPKLINKNYKTGGYIDFFNDKFPKDKPVRTAPLGKISCPVRDGVYVYPHEIKDIDYIKQRILITTSIEKTRKWMNILSDLLTELENSKLHNKK